MSCALPHEVYQTPPVEVRFGGVIVVIQVTSVTIGAANATPGEITAANPAQDDISAAVAAPGATLQPLRESLRGEQGANPARGTARRIDDPNALDGRRRGREGEAR